MARRDRRRQQTGLSPQLSGVSACCITRVVLPALFSCNSRGGRMLRGPLLIVTRNLMFVLISHGYRSPCLSQPAATNDQDPSLRNEEQLSISR